MATVTGVLSGTRAEEATMDRQPFDSKTLIQFFGTKKNAKRFAVDVLASTVPGGVSGPPMTYIDATNKIAAHTPNFLACMTDANGALIVNCYDNVPFDNTFYVTGFVADVSATVAVTIGGD